MENIFDNWYFVISWKRSELFWRMTFNLGLHGGVSKWLVQLKVYMRMTEVLLLYVCCKESFRLNFPLGYFSWSQKSCKKLNYKRSVIKWLLQAMVQYVLLQNKASFTSGKFLLSFFLFEKHILVKVVTIRILRRKRMLLFQPTKHTSFFDPYVI